MITLTRPEARDSHSCLPPCALLRPRVAVAFVAPASVTVAFVAFAPVAAAFVAPTSPQNKEYHMNHMNRGTTRSRRDSTSDAAGARAAQALNQATRGVDPFNQDGRALVKHKSSRTRRASGNIDAALDAVAAMGTHRGAPAIADAAIESDQGEGTKGIAGASAMAAPRIELDLSAMSESAVVSKNQRATYLFKYDAVDTAGNCVILNDLKAPEKVVVEAAAQTNSGEFQFFCGTVIKRSLPPVEGSDKREPVSSPAAASPVAISGTYQAIDNIDGNLDKSIRFKLYQVDGAHSGGIGANDAASHSDAKACTADKFGKCGTDGTKGDQGTKGIEGGIAATVNGFDTKIAELQLGKFYTLQPTTADELVKLFVLRPKDIHPDLARRAEPCAADVHATATAILHMQAQKRRGVKTVVPPAPEIANEMLEHAHRLFADGKINTCLKNPGYCHAVPTNGIFLGDSYSRLTPSMVDGASELDKPFTAAPLHVSRAEKVMHAVDKTRMFFSGACWVKAACAIEAACAIDSSGDNYSCAFTDFVPAYMADANKVDFGNGSTAMDEECLFAHGHLEQVLKSYDCAILFGGENRDTLLNYLCESPDVRTVVGLSDAAIAKFALGYPPAHRRHFGSKSNLVLGVTHKNGNTVIIFLTAQFGSTLGQGGWPMAALTFYDKIILAFIDWARGTPYICTETGSFLGNLLTTDGAADFTDMAHRTGYLTEGTPFKAPCQQGGATTALAHNTLPEKRTPKQANIVQKQAAGGAISALAHNTLPEKRTPKQANLVQKQADGSAAGGATTALAHNTLPEKRTPKQANIVKKQAAGGAASGAAAVAAAAAAAAGTANAKQMASIKSMVEGGKTTSKGSGVYASARTFRASAGGSHPRIRTKEQKLKAQQRRVAKKAERLLKSGGVEG